MTHEQRIAAYAAQRNYGRLTDRQWRRIDRARAKAGLPAVAAIVVPLRPAAQAG